MLSLIFLSFIASAEPSKGEKVKQKAKETVEATKDYASEKKEAFVDRMNRELKELDKSIDELSLKTKSASAAAKEETKEAIVHLKSRRDQLREDLKNFGNSTDAAVKDLRKGFRKALDELSAAVKSAREKFKD